MCLSCLKRFSLPLCFENYFVTLDPRVGNYSWETLSEICIGFQQALAISQCFTFSPPPHPPMFCPRRSFHLNVLSWFPFISSYHHVPSFQTPRSYIPCFYLKIHIERRGWCISRRYGINIWRCIDLESILQILNRGRTILGYRLNPCWLIVKFQLQN